MTVSDEEDLRRFEALVHASPDFIAIAGMDGKVSFVNAAGRRLAGMPDDVDVAQTTIADYLTPEGVEASARIEQPAVVAHGRWAGETTLRDWRDDTAIPVAATSFLMADVRTGEPLALATVRRDLRPLLREQQMQQSQTEVLELMAAGADLPQVLAGITRWVEDQLGDTLCSILLTDGPSRLPLLRQGASPSMPKSYLDAVEAASGAILASPCAVAVSLGEPVLVADLLADARWEPLHGLARSCGLRSCWTFPVLSPATGDTLGTFALYRTSPGVPDARTRLLIERGSHLVGIGVDRSRLVARLDHQAHHDALTGLPNRVRLLQFLTAALADRAKGIPAPIVIFLDLDRLKIINDSLGHEVGDELLVDIATRLRAAVEPQDEVARFGGDEFVVLVDVTHEPRDPVDVVERVLATVADVVVLHGRSLSPSASAGVVVTAPDQTATEVLRDADIAMYRAKRRGGNNWVLFDQTMQQRAYDRLDLEAQIRSGITDEQFLLHYQPIVDMTQNDRLVGFEALVRWAHPLRGLLGPDTFIDLAEETGLILPLGDFVLRAAAATAAEWSRRVQSDGLYMSVNLAPQQLSAAGLTVLVGQCVREAAPWRLGLELTESTAMDDALTTRQIVAELAASGAELAIDDFGTGYSSLSYLTRLPVRRLKIDRSFVAELGRRSEASTVAAAIVSLAGNLGLSVVAEGVETAEQRERLLALAASSGRAISSAVRCRQMTRWRCCSKVSDVRPEQGESPGVV